MGDDKNLIFGIVIGAIIVLIFMANQMPKLQALIMMPKSY